MHYSLIREMLSKEESTAGDLVTGALAALWGMLSSLRTCFPTGPASRQAGC
jgi:hypothetical protein